MFLTAVDETFNDVINRFLLVYFDDLLVSSEDPMQHENHVRLVLQKLRDAGLCVKLEKCEFNTTEVEFQGYVVSTEGIKMDHRNTYTIQGWSSPTDVKGVLKNDICVSKYGWED
jgi:hypothetical protein